ncbi:hypothetical protein [Streptomyces alkaliphilus]|uniref:hypothetical protein n=1 Tax=Streptomyces alkaliphilus TaxID=1472722 RepID=UPI0012979070|nr:hypothetical protein [Streptomyces alkaliphilus]
MTVDRIPAARCARTGPGWWVTGRCRLGCEREDLPVQWVGPVEVGIERADLYGCADCLARLRTRVIEEAGRR